MGNNVLLVLLGGGIGSVCRYLFSQLAVRLFGTGFSWGTLGVNLIGCLLIGFGFALSERSLITPQIRILFMTGFLGGLTTFSTYALESFNLMNRTEWLQALGNLTANNLGGLLLVFVGIWVGRSI